MLRTAIDIPKQKIAEFCKRHHIRRLSLFGSVLREDFHSDSDVDVLVEFEPGHSPGLLMLSAMERELSAEIGRPVDIRTIRFFAPQFRSKIMREAEVQYAVG